MQGLLKMCASCHRGKAEMQTSSYIFWLKIWLEMSPQTGFR